MISSSTLLAEIASEWNRIERRAKQVETLRGEAIVASINEMRYAGRRIVDAIAAAQGGASDADDQMVEHLIVARTYLVNADHDLTDSVIFLVHKRIKETEDRYSQKKINKHCPEFYALYPAIKEAQIIVQGSREDRKLRAAEYQRLASDYIPKLLELHDKLHACKALRIEQTISVLERNVRLVAWLSFIGSVASVIGLVLAIWGIYLAWPSVTNSAANTPSTLGSPAAPSKG